MGVVVVNYNTRDELRACLASVVAAGATEIVVVDNNSSDGSVEMVAAEYPGAIVLAEGNNPGFGAAANKGVNRCTSKYVLILNSDTLLGPETLGALTTYLDREPRAGLVGSTLVYPDGQIQQSIFPPPSPINVLIGETALERIAPHIPVIGIDWQTPSRASQRVGGWITGAAVAVRRDVFATLGGFDESFFMYYEEVDLCYRMQRLGWEVHFAPVTTITHIGRASTRQFRSSLLPQGYRSLMRFSSKHHSRSQVLLLRSIVTYVMVRNLARDVVHLGLDDNPEQRANLRDDIRAWRRFLPEIWRARQV